MRLALEQIAKSYGGKQVLSDCSLSLAAGDFLVILGRSGCGKSTLLRIAAGLEQPDGGRVLLDGAPVTAPGGGMMIFQDPNQLFPWMTVEQNVIYAMKKKRLELARDAMQRRAAECLAEVGLTEAAGKWPHELSGGMKQRAALARALALDARVMFLDEPFCSLDYLTRRHAQETLTRVWRASGMTVVFVTHDIEEAAALATRIAVFDGGGKIGTIFENDGSPDLRTRLETLLLA